MPHEGKILETIDLLNDLKSKKNEIIDNIQNIRNELKSLDDEFADLCRKKDDLYIEILNDYWK